MALHPHPRPTRPHEKRITDFGKVEAPVRPIPTPQKKTLAEALSARVKFEDQDSDEQFYPARCDPDRHMWHEDADAEGDTCNCGEWYRFADRIERTGQ